MRACGQHPSVGFDELTEDAYSIGVVVVRCHIASLVLNFNPVLSTRNTEYVHLVDFSPFGGRNSDTSYKLFLPETALARHNCMRSAKQMAGSTATSAVNACMCDQSLLRQCY
jgi:hypothetical protein